MGCDIHLEIEKRGTDGLWHLVPHIDAPCKYCIPDSKDTCFVCDGSGHYTRGFYSDRDYDVFAMLANVRNGVLFGGGDLGDGYLPLADDRGFPDDLSPELARVLDREENGPDEDDEEDREPTIWMGDHSFTWLLYSELLDEAYWRRTTKLRGWVDPWNFEIWRRKGVPVAWAGGVYGNHIEYVSNSFLAHVIDSGDLQWVGDEQQDMFAERQYTTSYDRTVKGGKGKAATKVQTASYYTLVEWEVKYGDQAEDFMRQMEETIELLGNPAPEDVRLVMGFDS